MYFILPNPEAVFHPEKGSAMHDWAAQHPSQGRLMAPGLRAATSGLGRTHMLCLGALPKSWNEHGAAAPSPSA